MASGNRPGLRVLRGQDPAGPQGRGGDALLTLLRVATRSTKAMGEVVRGHGLTMAQVEVLLCLDGGEGVTQQDLAGRLLVTKGNVCVTVQRMEAAGLVDRRPDPLDQRARRLFLTDAGRRQLAAVRPDHAALVWRIVGGLAPPEQATLYGLLARLEQELDEVERGPTTPPAGGR